MQANCNLHIKYRFKYRLNYKLTTSKIISYLGQCGLTQPWICVVSVTETDALKKVSVQKSEILLKMQIIMIMYLGQFPNSKFFQNCRRSTLYKLIITIWSGTWRCVLRFINACNAFLYESNHVEPRFSTVKSKSTNGAFNRSLIQCI